MKILAAVLLSVIMISSGFMINSPATAAPNDHANENAKRSFKLPDNAIEIAPGIYHIGTVLHQGKVLDGIVAFDHKPKHNPGGPGGGGNGDTTSTCYAFLGNGVKWKVAEPYLVDPTNTSNLDEQIVRDRIADAISTWENAAQSDILGNEIPENPNDPIDGIDEVSPDGKNEILFGNIVNDGVIAVNIGWGIFRGPPSERELVEWDQMYDDVDFDWGIDQGNNADPLKMDFLNIATHEVGHATGMAHPDNSCTEETMYAFASAGETKKQTLNAGDEAGIKILY